MKINMFKSAVAASVLAGALFGANAAEAASANATASARILRQVTLTKTSDLQFGTIVTGASAATVDVDGAGARTCGGGLVCSGTTTAAAFTVGGTAGQVVAVAFPASLTLLTPAGATGPSMSATLASYGLTAGAVTMNASNAGAFQLGGTLSVGANQADGNYTASFTVTADYQ